MKASAGLSAIPTLDPTTSLLVGLVILLGVAVVANQNNKWVLNVLSLTPAVSIGVGFVLFFGLPAPWRLVGVLPIAAVGLLWVLEFVDFR